MKKKFSVEQIVGVVEAGRGGSAGGRADPQGRYQRADILPVEEAAHRA